MEIINDYQPRGKFKAALFDFDGTVSLIRQGWQEVMETYFTDVLMQACGSGDRSATAAYVRNFIDELTGVQTIYQCIRLAEEVAACGGRPADPLEYKREYHRRLMQKIEHRIQGLKEGRIKTDDLLVPGAVSFLRALQERGVALYLASGTDEIYVRQEAELLGISSFFAGNIYGALDNYKSFSKEMVIRKILAEHDYSGCNLLGVGDGYVEIQNVKAAGGMAVGVATDELACMEVDTWKRHRLINAGADVVIPNYINLEEIMDYLFGSN
ncbi:MAG TPA: HAD family hydrolase [Firmicutes bacterium]|nr:HAD family hydrolase [Bacillota bacterium]